MRTHSSQDLKWWQTEPEAFLFHCLASSQNTYPCQTVFTAFVLPEWISSVTPICESYFVIWGKKTLREKHSSSSVLCLGLGFSLNAGFLGWPCTLIRCALWHCAHSRKTRWESWRDERLKAWHRAVKNCSRWQGRSFFLLWQWFALAWLLLWRYCWFLHILIEMMYLTGTGGRIIYSPLTQSKCCTTVPSKAVCLCLGAVPRNQMSFEPQMRTCNRQHSPQQKEAFG